MAPRAFLQHLERPLAFAHRGGAKLWPENTLLAFEGAIGLGIKLLETDIHMSRDGELVVHHDDRLERTTNGKGLVKDHTFNELRALDAGYHFAGPSGDYPYRGKGLTLPTLDEVFALSPDVRLNVEIKQRHPDPVPTLLRYLDERGLGDRILIAAAQDPIIVHFRRMSQGRIATGASLNEALRFWAASRLGLGRHLAPAYDALQVPKKHGVLTVVDDRFLACARAHRIEVHVWTIDAPETMRALIEMGVDGIMSDRPDYLMQVLPPHRA